MKIALLDHYDSFTYNLKSLIESSFSRLKIVVITPNMSMQDVRKIDAKFIVFGPGPGRPEDYPLSLSVFESYWGQKPILGICLGLQIAGIYSGGRVVKAKRPMHGKVSSVQHIDSDFWKGIPKTFHVMRYHSLVVENADKMNLEAFASEDKAAMAYSSKEMKFFGLQFHPESYASQYGKQVIRNFINVYS